MQDDRTILLCTLGASWAVIPEVVALLDPDRVPLYRDHPEKCRIEQMRREYELRIPDEVWVVTTGGKTAKGSLNSLREWNQMLAQPYPLRVWIAAETDQLDSIDQTSRFRELVFRVVLKASKSHLYLSLAGGRKTMSTDLQKAASAFGCRQMFHVTGIEPLPDALRSADPSDWLGPLSSSDAEGVMPLLLSGESRSELLDIEAPPDFNPVRSSDFPPGNATSDGSPLSWKGESNLVDDFADRRKQGGQLFGNFLSSLAKQEHHENWRMLYRLPPEQIIKLRETPINEADREWLKRLPKADLHRHIGGCLDLNGQIAVGRSVWQAMSNLEQKQALDHVSKLLEKSDWGWGWPKHINSQNNTKERAHRAAALLNHASYEQLFNNLYTKTEPRIALNKTHRHGFDAYERPGELTGSAILQHEAAIEPYARLLIEQADREGLHYVELRGSPQKYLGGDGFRFLELIKSAMAGDNRFRFIVIADRRQSNQVDEAVRIAVEAQQKLDGFVVGLDLAGKESAIAPKELATHFSRAFEKCLPITIHAGEGEPAERIWEAAYHLHPDRIGHGLTLHNHKQLMERFRDRDI